MSRVLGSFKSSVVFYMVSYLGSDLVLGKKLVLDLGLGSSSIFFIVRYQSFWYSYVVSLSFYLVRGGIVLEINCWGLADILNL
jgi:hypothetical protein